MTCKHHSYSPGQHSCKLPLRKHGSTLHQLYTNQLEKNFSCFNFNVSVKNLKGLERIKSQFWKQVLVQWIENKHLFSPTISQFSQQGLWNNRNIVYKNKTLFFSQWIDVNLINVCDIWLNGDIISFNQLCEKVGYTAKRIFVYSCFW